MKALWPAILCVGALTLAARAGDLEPAVQTSTAAAAPAAPVEPAAAATPARTPVAPAARAGAASRTGPRAGGTPKVQDRLELESTQITGNKELPKVMYVVPWRRPDLGEFAGKPPNSLLDELLTPVDRDVFRRQNRYFTALQPDAQPAASASGDHSPAAAKDEK